MARRRVRNLLALGLLALLMGQPMHPYEMARMLRRTGKERDLKIKWGSFYTVVQNLERYGLIEATESTRDGRRPERTVYAITDAGRTELRDWMRELVAEPDTEAHRFEAALSVLGVLPPDEVSQLLPERVRALDGDINAVRALLKESSARVPRVFLIELEYALAMRNAEAAWVRGLLTELAEGSISGLDEWREYHETGRMPAGLVDLLDEGGARGE